MNNNGFLGLAVLIVSCACVCLFVAFLLLFFWFRDLFYKDAARLSSPFPRVRWPASCKMRRRCEQIEPNGCSREVGLIVASGTMSLESGAHGANKEEETNSAFNIPNYRGSQLFCSVKTVRNPRELTTGETICANCISSLNELPLPFTLTFACSLAEFATIKWPSDKVSFCGVVQKSHKLTLMT